MGTVISTPVTGKKALTFNIIKSINAKIEQEKENAIGISIVFIMFGTGLASLTAALALQGDVSMIILMTAITLTMATNSAVISQQPLKTTAWLFIINFGVNTILLFYQILI